MQDPCKQKKTSTMAFEDITSGLIEVEKNKIQGKQKMDSRYGYTQAQLQMKGLGISSRINQLHS